MYHENERDSHFFFCRLPSDPFRSCAAARKVAIWSSTAIGDNGGDQENLHHGVKTGGHLEFIINGMRMHCKYTLSKIEEK
jgi:hypothetical protein